MSDSDVGDSRTAFAAALQARLVKDLGMHVNAAEIIAQGLAETGGAIREQAQRWLDDGTIPSMEVDGVSIEAAISDGWADDPLSGLLLMDELQRDPVRTRRIIARGHDEIRDLPGRGPSGS